MLEQTWFELLILLRHSELMHEALLHIYTGYQIGRAGEKIVERDQQKGLKTKGKNMLTGLPLLPVPWAATFLLLTAEQCDLGLLLILFLCSTTQAHIQSITNFRHFLF